MHGKPAEGTGAVPKKDALGFQRKQKQVYLTSSKSATRVATKKTESKPSKNRLKKFELPPLSIPMQVKELTEGQKELIEWRKKTTRRNIPDGENVKKINEITRNTKGQLVTVQEFVGLVAPYTADQGNVLRNIMDAELSSFRKMARKIYETMTQDVSDVLANEQVQLMSSFKEKHTQYSDKMMRCIDEIFHHVPDFDFERYFRDSEYLSEVLPIPKEKSTSSEDEEQILRKQEAFHRIEWLRKEGERLQCENKKLQHRLREVKNLQKLEMEKAAQAEEDAERRRCELLGQQDELKERLDLLNQSIEKTVICGETTSIKMDKERRKCIKAENKKKNEPCPKHKTPKRPPWNVIPRRDDCKDLLETEIKLSQSGSVSTQPSLAKIKKKKSALRKKKWDFSAPKVPQVNLDIKMILKK